MAVIFWHRQQQIEKLWDAIIINVFTM